MKQVLCSAVDANAAAAAVAAAALLHISKNTCLLAIVRSFCNDSIPMMHGCECDIQIC